MINIYFYVSRSDGAHKLYVLFAAESASSETCAPLAQDILKNIRNIA